MSAAPQTLSPAFQFLVEKIRQHILATGHASMDDLGGQGPEQIRVLESLDIIERVGDELRLVRR